MNVQSLKALFKPVIEDQLQTFPIFMQLELSKHIKNLGSVGGQNTNAPVFNTGNQIYSVSGKLWKSFVRRNTEGNIYQMQDIPSGKKLIWGTSLPYANIHEFGGFIKGTPITVIKSKAGRPMRKSTVQMAQFFWAKWYETKSPFYRRLALSAERKKGVNMKARPFFAPAVKSFRADGQKKFEDQMKNAIVKGIREWLGKK